MCLTLNEVGGFRKDTKHQPVGLNKRLEKMASYRQHHKTISYKDEYKALLKEFGIEFDEKDMD